MTFRRDFLLSFSDLNFSFIAEHESIEQMRIIENEYSLYSLSVNPTTPSVNEPSDVEIVMNNVANCAQQSSLLQRALEK